MEIVAKNAQKHFFATKILCDSEKSVVKIMVKIVVNIVAKLDVKIGVKIVNFVYIAISVLTVNNASPSTYIM